MKTRTITVICTLLLCFLGCTSAGTVKQNIFSLDEAVSQAVLEIGGKLEPGKRTVVANFIAGTPEVSGYLIDELTSSLAAGGKTLVVDRNNIVLMQKELNFNMSGYVSDETAQGIGKLVAANYIVSGSLSDEGNIVKLQVSVMQTEHTSPDFIFSANILKDDSFESVLAGIQSGQKKAPVILDRGDSFDNTDSIFDEGCTFFNNGDYDHAIERFTRVIAVLPEFVWAYNNRAAAYIKKGKYQEAITDCNKALSIFPKYAGPYGNISAVYVMMKNADGAIEASNKAIEIDPSFADAYGNRGTAYAMKNEFDKALADCDHFIALRHSIAQPYFVRGQVLFLKEDYNGAIQDWVKAIELEPNNPLNQQIRRNIGTASLKNTLQRN